jgi:hypothetical protein
LIKLVFFNRLKLKNLFCAFNYKKAKFLVYVELVLTFLSSLIIMYYLILFCYNLRITYADRWKSRGLSPWLFLILGKGPERQMIMRSKVMRSKVIFFQEIKRTIMRSKVLFFMRSKVLFFMRSKVLFFMRSKVSIIFDNFDQESK